jgi:hypothetical protein
MPDKMSGRLGNFILPNNFGYKGGKVGKVPFLLKYVGCRKVEKVAFLPKYFGLLWKNPDDLRNSGSLGTGMLPDISRHIMEVEKKFIAAQNLMQEG